MAKKKKGSNKGKNAQKRKRKTTATVESVTCDLEQLESSHSRDEWSTIEKNHSKYRRAQVQLKNKQLDPKTQAAWLDEEKRTESDYKLWKKRKNLLDRIKQLQKVAAAEGGDEDLDSQDVERSKSGTTTNTATAPDEGATVPPVVPKRNSTKKDSSKVEGDGFYFCLFCYTKHSGESLDNRSPYLLDTSDPISIMKGNDNFDSACEYCFLTNDNLQNHIQTAHTPSLLSESTDIYNNIMTHIEDFNEIRQLFRLYAIDQRVPFFTFEKSDPNAELLDVFKQKLLSCSPDCNFPVDTNHDQVVINHFTRNVFSKNEPRNTITVVNQRQSNPSSAATDQFNLLIHNDAALERIRTGREMLNVCKDSTGRRNRSDLHHGARKVISMNHSNTGAAHSDFILDYQICSLENNRLIGDEVINIFFERVLRPLFGENTIFLRTDFHQLWRTNYDDASYSVFDLIDSDLLGEHDTIFHVDQIIVPIIKESASHWLLQNVDMERKVIEIRDSLGYNPLNEHYFWEMVHFLFYMHIEVDAAPMSYEDFAREWTFHDMSLTCSLQRDSVDCGVFVIVNALLLSQNMIPTPELFDQEHITDFNIREKIISIIIQLGEVHEEYKEDLQRFQQVQSRREKAKLAAQRRRHASLMMERDRILRVNEDRERLRSEQGKRRRDEYNQYSQHPREDYDEQQVENDNQTTLLVETTESDADEQTENEEQTASLEETTGSNYDRDKMCQNCRRKQFDRSGGLYTLKFTTVRSDQIKMKANFKFVKASTKDSSNVRHYDLCSQCYDHLVEGKKDYHSEIYPCIWNILSGSHDGNFHEYTIHHAADMKRLWQLIPESMRKWWYDSVERIWGDHFTDDIKLSPSVFSDRSIEYQEFLAKLSGSHVNMSTLRDALETQGMMNRQVLCPWGCSCNVRTSGRIGLDLILQRFLQSVIIKPTSPNKDMYEKKARSCWQQYIREPGDYDAIMYNFNEWRVTPHIHFDSQGPYVLTCPHHDGGTPYNYLFPPMSPHLFNATSTDQIAPICVKPRIKHPVRRGVHSTTFKMQQMRCTFAGADTADITGVNDFTKFTNSTLLGDHHALIMAGRPDIASFVENLFSQKGATPSQLADELRNKATERYPSEILLKLSQGATYTSFDDSMFLHLNSNKEISATGMSKRNPRRRDIEEEEDEEEEAKEQDNDIDDEQNYRPYNVVCRPSWSSRISLVQMEDHRGFGIQPYAIPQYSKKNTAVLTTWILSALLMGSKELWEFVQNKRRPFHVWSWEGWLLTYLDTNLPYRSSRVDPRSPFKKAQISTIDGILKKIGDFENRYFDRQEMSWTDKFHALFPVGDYPYLSFYDEFHLATDDPLLEGQRAFIYIGNEKPTQERLVIGDDRFELRVILKVRRKSDKDFDAVRYLRFGDKFHRWWKQERGDPIVTKVADDSDRYNLFDRLSVDSGDCDCIFLYVNTVDINKEKYRIQFHESMGGQSVIRCSCNDRPLIPSSMSRDKKKERNARCNCPCDQPICNRYEYMVCSSEKCPLRVCKTCFDKHTESEREDDTEFVRLTHISRGSEEGKEDDDDDDDDDDDGNFGGEAQGEEEEEEEDNQEENVGVIDRDEDALRADDYCLRDLDQNLEHFLVTTPDMNDYMNLGRQHDLLPDDDELYDGFETSDAGQTPIQISHDDNMTRVNGHVVLNQVASCTRRGNHVINGTQKQKSFVQRYTHTVAGVSYPLMYIEANEFPRHFFCTAADDPDAILGARALPFYSTNREFGIASPMDHAKVRITCPSSTTSSDPNYHFHLWDVLANFTLSGNNSKDVNERGFIVDPKSPLGISVRAKGESPLSGDIDSCQMVRNLGASQKYVPWSVFLTQTLNHSGHPGVKHLYEWKESQNWLHPFIGKSIDRIGEERELINAFENVYAPHCFTNWMETRFLLIQFIKENVTHLGAVTHVFSRDEYQDDAGNVPHQHLILAIEYSHLGIHEQEKIQNYISSLVATSSMEIMRPEDVHQFAKEGLINGVSDERIRLIQESAETYLPHECIGDRCKMRVDHTGDKEKDFKCKKPHPVKDHPDPTNPAENAIKEIPYPFCQETLDILEECGKYDPDKVCEDANHPDGCQNCKFLHTYFKSRRFMPRCNKNATDNMSPVDRRLFAVCDSMQNIQLLFHTGGLCKYLVKYLIKRDKINRALASADVHTGDIKVGKERIHNSKIATSEYNEEKAFEKSRMKDHDTGRSLSHVEAMQQLLGIPEIITNLVFFQLSTQPFGCRPQNQIRRKPKGGVVIGYNGRPRSQDAHHAGIPMKKVRDQMGLIKCRRMSTHQQLTYREHDGGTTRYDEISAFGLRPSELNHVVENPVDYYRLFYIEEEETDLDIITKGMKVSLDECLWYDYLQRRVRIRHLAKAELKELVLQNIKYYTELAYHQDDNDDSVDNRTKAIADFEEKKQFALSMNRMVLQLTQSEENPETFIHIDPNEMLPIVVLSNVSPLNSHNFFIHIALSLGKYVTEKEVLLHRNSRECFRAARLIGNDDNEEALKRDAIQLMCRYIDEQLVYYPNSFRLVEVYLHASRDFFMEAILKNEFPVNELPPYTMTDVCAAFDDKFNNFWPEMISSQVDSCLNTLSAIDGVPSKEEIVQSSRENPMDWNPKDTFHSQNEHQSLESFNEQSLAISKLMERIDCYIINGKGIGKEVLRYIRNLVIHGSPGTGKSFVTQIGVLYAISKGLRVMSSSLMSVRAIVIGGIHLHKFICLRVGNKVSPFRTAQEALRRIYQKPEYLYALQTCDVFFIDEIGQLSDDFLSVIDIIFRQTRDSRTPFGGCLILGSMDHKQIPPIEGMPFLLSSLVLTSFDMFELRHSVRAHSDVKFQRFQQILRMNVSELLDEDGRPNREIKDEFDTLIDDPNFIQFKDGWDDDIPTGITRIYSRKEPARTSITDMITSLEAHLNSTGTPYVTATSRDLQRQANSHGEWQTANNTNVRALNSHTKEPEKLILTSYCMYEFTVNSTSDDSSQYSQSQDCLLINVPDQRAVDNFQPFKVLAAPPGRPIEFDFDDIQNRPSKEDLINNHGWKEVTVRKTPDQLFRKGQYQCKREQYTIKHKGASTINKSQGETYHSGVAVEITERYSPWQKGQCVVVFSRATHSKHMIVVGSRQFAKKKIWDLITQRTQWCLLMDQVLHLVTINNEGEDMPTLDYTTNFPFTISNIPMPREYGGYLYFLISHTDMDEVYIGSTNNISKRVKQHNSGYGSSSTKDYRLRPWALAGYITGLSNDPNELKIYENRYKELIDGEKARGIFDVYSWVKLGEVVASEFNKSDSSHNARFVITIERGRLRR